MPSHVVVLGGTLVGVRAARRLAAAGHKVTLLEVDPFLGQDLPAGNANWMPAVPDLLESVRDPNITVLTLAEVESVIPHGKGFRLQVEQSPRYVDPARCTACGECEKVCPVDPLQGNNGQRRTAIYCDPPGRSVPNVYVIEKRGEPPCTHACPGGIHVQGYVALIAQGKFRRAHDLIAQAIPFPGICGRVCHHPCESQCSRRELDESIAVRSLKRFVSDYVATRGGLHWERPVPDPTLSPVAVIGAGPAGLAAAWELARQGVQVTVFEALPVVGGMMMVGIPAYRLPRAALYREVAAVEALGVELRLNTPLGPDLTLEDLFAQGYKAIFLGLGAHRSRHLRVEGEDLSGVVHATDLLRAVSLSQEEGVSEDDLPRHLQKAWGIEIRPRAVVVGGGNSAVDAARTLLRLGVKEVRILYRRSRREMPALAEEVDAAEEEGVHLDILATPAGIMGQDGRVTAVECVRMELGEPDESGRRRPIPVPGSEFTLQTDMVVPAIGQQPKLPPLPAELCDDGWLCVDPVSGRTPLPGVFAAGDVVRPASVIEAIGAGKRVGHSILRYLRGEQEQGPPILERPVARLTAEDLEERIHQSRQAPSVLPPRRRRRDFAEVEQAFTAEQAVVEARRCLTCGICSECLECLAVCSPGAIHHQEQPCSFELEADAILLAGDCALDLPEQVYRLSEGDPQVAVQALLSTLAVEETRPVLAQPRTFGTASAPTHLGVFLCRCGEQIAGTVDLESLQEQVAGLSGVAHVEQIPFACLPEGITRLREATAGLDGVVLGACSCCNLAQVCYSCTTQRVRCRDGLGVWDDEARAVPPAWVWEYVNLREHGVWARQPNEAFAVAAGSIAAAVARLAAGPVIPRVAVVDAARCRACGTCQTLCQAEAIYLAADDGGRMWAHVDTSRCLACGTCAAHCPTGAVLAGRVSDRQLEVTHEALLSSGGGRVLVFSCNWGGHSGAEVVGMRRQMLPPGVRTVRVPCLGRLSPGLLLQALEQGAAGVLLAGCHEDGCRYEFGQDMAVEAFSRARALADLLGLGAERLEWVGIAPGDGMTFAREVTQFVARLEKALASSRKGRYIE